MWLLESDGDVFHGKRLWLRPGKKFIFGRTSAEAGGFVVENKTISRKHLVIEVETVKSGNSAKPDTRSVITLEDLNTKIGTLVNGAQIRGQRHVLAADKNEIKLGQYDKLFRISWNPVVFSFTSIGKGAKTNSIKSFHDKLGGLDFKILPDYIRESTTHVIAKKRNTSNGLQALINGKYIVDYTFIDAVLAVTKSESDQVSPLEADFESNWPNELQYLPPRGKEPTERLADAYAPDSGREEIFKGYAFVFCDQSQFETLLAPITNGGGKALLYQVDPSTTDIEDFIRYAKDVAGEKGLGEFEDRSEGKGVVVVRYHPAQQTVSDWHSDFAKQVALHLDHRLVEQNEFLDAILNNDARVLRIPLELEQSGMPVSTAAPPAVITATPGLTSPITSGTRTMIVVDNVPRSSASHGAPPGRRVGRSRRTVTSRFKGFDNDFDTPGVNESNLLDDTQHPQLKARELGLFVPHEQDTASSWQSKEISDEEIRLSKKRPPPSVASQEEDILDQLAPAATSLKRRRLADEQARRLRGDPTPPPPPLAESKAEVTKTTRKKVKTEIDVLKIARQRREKEEEIARADREALQEAMDGMEIGQIRNLAVIEESEVKRSAPPPRTIAHGNDGDRWDERWNGRKNFKKFRRIGEGGPRPLNKVIVPLEEVKKKDFGISDEYWLGRDKDSSRKKREKSHVKETQSTAFSQAQSTAAQREGDETVDAMENETIEVQTVSQRLSVTRAQKPSASAILSPNRVAHRKRLAEPLTEPAPAKKARQATRREDSDDSDDGLGFRFRRRK